MSRFLKALEGKNEGRPPVWLMRQAGRFLPEYQAYRKRHALETLFFTPQHIEEITRLPVDLLGVDAAVLFSDITVVAKALGSKLWFSEGPRVDPFLDGGKREIRLEALDPIFEGIDRLKRSLEVPLIGFCGAPFTVSEYLKSPEGGDLKAVLDQIHEVNLQYVQEQVKRGVDVVQIFDSAACKLSEEEFLTYCLPYYQSMMEKINTKWILFVKGTNRFLTHLMKLPCALGIDETIECFEVRKKTHQVLQGNLGVEVLFEGIETVEKKASALLKSMQGDKGFIFNLSHGVRPKTPVAAVQKLIEVVERG